MDTIRIPVEIIQVGNRHRPLDGEAVKRLAASMGAIGLRSPITVRVVDDYVTADGEVCDGVPVLVAGHHRLAAAKSLGWTHIDCVDVDDDEISAELWELAENLHRLDLTKEQRDEHIRRYAELLQSRQSVAIESKRDDGRGHRSKGVASQVAEQTGLSVRTVQRALNPAPSSAEPPKEVFDVHEQARRRLMNAWNAATEADRQWFRDWIDGPLMDN